MKGDGQTPAAAVEAESLTIALRTRELEADVGLMLALGGGWSAPPPSAPRTIDVTPPPVQMLKEASKGSL